jgi:ParB family chromosome partitioning protein
VSERRRLGRGLDALIPKEGRGGAREIPVDAIMPNPQQPRRPGGSEALQELADSITAHGVIQPVVVREVPGSVPPAYELIAGERRWRATQLAGLETIPAIVKDASPREMLEIALVENLQREDLNPLEEATAYRVLAEEFNLSHEEIAQQIGRSRPAITNTMRLLHLPPAVQQHVAGGELSAGHARALLALPSTQDQVEVMRQVLDENMSVRQTELLVRELLRERLEPEEAPEPAPRPARAPRLPAVVAMEERFREALGTRCSLKWGEKGGRLTIYFYSDEEIDHLLDLLERLSSMI